MPRAYDRRQLVVDRNPLAGIVPDPGKLPKLDAAALWAQWLAGLKELTGLDLSSPEKLVESLGELIGGVLDPENIVALVGQVLGFTGTATNLDELVAWVSENLWGPIDPGRIGVLPVSQIGEFVASLLPNGLFDSASSVLDPSGKWVFDEAVGKLSPGSVRTTADGTIKDLLSLDLIALTPGHVLDVAGSIKWSGLVATGSPIEVGLVTYSDAKGKNMVGRPVIAAPTGQTGTADWKAVSGQYTVPESGVKSARVRVTLRETATAGSVWYDEVDAYKTNLMPLRLVEGLSARLADLLGIDVWQEFLNAAKGGPGGVISDLINRIVHLGVDGSFDASQLSNTNNMPPVPGANIIGISGNILQDIGKHLDNVVNRFLGMKDTGHSFDDAAAAMGTIYNQVQTSAQTLQDLIARQTGDAHSGVSYTVKFADYPNGPFPSVFSLTYSGAGTGYLSVVDGKATWNEAANGDRQVIGKHEGVTLTDYQNIQGTVANPMDNGAADWLFGRCNAAVNTFVYARGTRNSLVDFRAELGCYVDGVQYVFASNVPANPNFNLQVRIGTGKGLRNFQVISGNDVIIDYTDSAGVSQVGTDKRGWGFISSTANGGNNIPANATVVSCADSDPSAATGSGAKMSRRNTSAATIQGGRVLAPVNYYDSMDLATPDIVPDVTNGKFTVSLSGWYRVEMAFQIGSFAFASAWNVAPVCFKNGVAHRIGTDAYAFYYFGVGAGARYAQTSFAVYLDAGDSVQAGYDASGVLSWMVGDAQGIGTYFGISLLNRSLG
ncbi:minor tail protein [Mycobacterium phage Ximenita]|uniref:Minor tail protein n=1 Tax=Mycobacterium phage Ximenita TaxID=2708633 RepID=A0A6G6XS50_9CAUD|nr:minor tail protein [Mycobacterium phage Ximenita]QIG61537.1 minor tail protein [Mycobacterium phage Ximenita]